LTTPAIVDPVCSEGHLHVEVNLDSNNVIRNAVSTGSMWRGLEVILKGRDPRDAWAFTERICGVCTGTHALTSVRAVEDALAIRIPENANTIRNLMQLNLYVHDHLVHFYHLQALDWVDVVSALKADPKKTSELAQSISDWPLSSPGYFRDVQNRLKKFVESGHLGTFTNRYWGSPAYKLPPEVNLMAVTHYMKALNFQNDLIKVHAILGGKNPHPSWLVGGVPCAINLSDNRVVGAINREHLNHIKSIIDRSREFIEKVYIPDLRERTRQAAGVGSYLGFVLEVRFWHAAAVRAAIFITGQPPNAEIGMRAFDSAFQLFLLTAWVFSKSTMVSAFFCRCGQQIIFQHRTIHRMVTLIYPNTIFNLFVGYFAKQ